LNDSGHQGPEWVRAFSRWSLLVEFELLDDGSRLCVFYNMGSDPKGPVAARRGKYFAAWTQANGELPRKGERMTPDVFLEGQVYAVNVKDCRRNAKEQEKADAEIEALSKELQYYQTSPRVEFTTLSNDRGYTFLAPVYSVPVAGSAFARNMKKPVSEAVWKVATEAGMPHLESQVIQIMLDLFRSGDICTITRCPCGKFVFQRFSHQRFCSQKCRIADYRSSEEFRIGRNKRQRELYQLHKKNNVK
jgi:hypothetical protein